MEYVKLGKSGLKISRIALGCMGFCETSNPAQPWTLNEADSRTLIAHAIEKGINFFDTANIYTTGASEAVLGRAIRDFARRDEVVIATKVCLPMSEKPFARGLSRKAIFNEVDASLKRLGMDYIDLYQIHRWDHETPIEETLEALHDVVKAGKARYLGASTMAAWEFAKALFIADRYGWTRFISMQPQYNLIIRDEEKEMFPLCADQNIGVMPWSPLARGFLSGNRTPSGGGETDRAKTDALAAGRFYLDRDFAQVERVANIARARNVSQAQVALAWVLANPVVTAPVVGVTRQHHIDEAIAAASIKFDPAEKECLEGVPEFVRSTHRQFK